MRPAFTRRAAESFRGLLQTSDALGAASVQLGPNVAALVVELHTEPGMPLERSSAFCAPGSACT